MAIQYSPQGRRVDLESPNSAGFNPVQTVDRSKQYLAAGSEAIRSFSVAAEADLANKEKDLKGLASMSKTLTEFFVKRQKGINEDTRKEYLAKALNAEIKPTPQAVQSYREGAEQLKTAAYQERANLSFLERIDRQAAVEIRENDPVLSGWAAYGQAEGLALRAKANAPLLGAMMKSTEKTIPVPGPDGQMEMISPAEAFQRGPAAFQAAWTASLRSFVEQMGLRNINPILLYDTVTPEVIAMRNRLMGESLEATSRRQQGIAKDSYLNKLGADVASLDTNNPEAVSAFIQRATLEGKQALGLATQGEANKEVVDLIGQLAVSRGDMNLLDNTRSTVVNPQDPNAITYGNHPIYGPLLRGYSDKVVAAKRAKAEDMEALNSKEVAQILTGFEIDVAPANDPGDFIAIRSKAIGILQGMGTPAAQEAIAKLLSQEFKGQEKFLLSIERQLRGGDKSITKRMIDKQITLGNLPSNAMDVLGRFFPTDQVDAIVEDMRSTVTQSATGALARNIKLDGANPELVAGLPTRRNQLVGETLEALRKYVAQDPAISRDKLNQYTENLIDAAITKDDRFKAIPGGPDAPLVPKWAKELVNGIVPPLPGGASTRPGAVDFSAIPGIEIKGGRPVDNYGGALGEAQKQLEQGQNVSKDIEARAKASGLTTTAFLASQQGQDALTNYATRANATLDNVRATPIQVAAARRQLDYIEQNQRSTAQPTASAAGESPQLTGALGSFAEELRQREGGPMGWEASNFGTADDNKTGRPGLTKMTINQALKLKDHHIGAYQFQLGDNRTLELLKKNMGLTGNELLTPDLQNRMFLELMYGGWKQPALTAYLKGGTNYAAAERAFQDEWEAGYKMDLRSWLPKLRAQYARTRGTESVPDLRRLSKANVLSINREEPGKDSFQPGVDLYFKDGKFPSLVAGVVKQVGFQGAGRGPSGRGYGKFVVIETTDPVTKETYDVLKAHLDEIHVNEGQQVSVGSVIGLQGSTGRTSEGGIASVDFLARAPRGSGSMKAYRRWREERERVLSLIK